MTRMQVAPEGTELRVSDVMAEPFVSIRPRMPAVDAAARMTRNRVHTAPVMTAEGALVGVLAASDLARAGIGSHVDRRPAPRDERGPLVAELMRPFAFTVAPTASVAEAEAVMARYGVHWLVVLDRRGHVVGVVSRSALHPAMVAGSENSGKD